MQLLLHVLFLLSQLYRRLATHIAFDLGLHNPLLCLSDLLLPISRRVSAAVEKHESFRFFWPFHAIPLQLSGYVQPFESPGEWHLQRVGGYNFSFKTYEK